MNPPKQNINMRIGTALHGAILENKGIDGFTNKQLIIISNMVNAVLSSYEWEMVTCEPFKVEQEHYWSLHGIDCKGIIDLESESRIIDVKSISDIGRVEQNINNYKYKYQLAWYALAMGCPDIDYDLLFVDKTINNNVELIEYRLSDLPINECHLLIKKFKTIKHKIITEF